LSVLDAAHQHITNLGKKAPHFNKDDLCTRQKTKKLTKDKA